MYSASDLRQGLKIMVEDIPYLITDFEFCKPGKGTALYRCRLKNMLTGSTMDRTFRPVDSFEVPNVYEREVQYSYKDGDQFVFSDDESFEETHVSAKVLDEKVWFLIEGMACRILYYNDQPIEVTFVSPFIEKVVVETEPGARGDTTNNVMKPAKVDNGYEIQVPIFINQGDTVRIDTRTGKYADRVKKG